MEILSCVVFVSVQRVVCSLPRFCCLRSSVNQNARAIVLVVVVSAMNVNGLDPTCCVYRISLRWGSAVFLLMGGVVDNQRSVDQCQLGCDASDFWVLSGLGWCQTDVVRVSMRPVSRTVSPASQPAKPAHKASQDAQHRRDAARPPTQHGDTPLEIGSETTQNVAITQCLPLSHLCLVFYVSLSALGLPVTCLTVVCHKRGKAPSRLTSQPSSPVQTPKSRGLS